MKPECDSTNLGEDRRVEMKSSHGELRPPQGKGSQVVKFRREETGASPGEPKGTERDTDSPCYLAPYTQTFPLRLLLSVLNPESRGPSLETHFIHIIRVKAQDNIFRPLGRSDVNTGVGTWINLSQSLVGTSLITSQAPR